MAVTRLTRFALSADDEAVLEAADRFARKGDHYALNGSKIHITNGPVADHAAGPGR